MKENQFDVPFQVQTLIDSMRNKKENEHIRNNYRMRLDSIRKTIDKALVEHDKEMGLTLLSEPRKSIK